MNVHFMAMTTAKTKEKLIEVARLLFAQKGVESTTMNDIAIASKKGRRTLYTYFKSKSEIYHAVLESEFKIMYISLEAVLNKAISADEKLLEFIEVRLDIIRKVVLRNGTLKAGFFRDIWRVENVRKGFDLQEINYIQTILNEGVNQHIFEIENTAIMAVVLHHAFKGFEVPYIRGMMKGFAPSDGGYRDNLVKLLYNGIKKQ